MQQAETEAAAAHSFLGYADGIDDADAPGLRFGVTADDVERIGATG